MSSPTPAQQAAIEAAGNILVSAGAGAGKTRTLVERYLAQVVNPATPAAVDNILVVTFTEAAAAEMRHRIRLSLEKRLAAAPEDEHLARQLALLETAPIGTLHGFCNRLVREHFYELEIDPQVTVMDEPEAKLLAAETLDNLLEAHYEAATENSQAVLRLIGDFGNGDDRGIRDAVRRLFAYARSLPDPEAWIRQQVELYQSGEPAAWRDWLLAGVGEWRANWIEALQAATSAAPDNLNALQCLRALLALPTPADRASLAKLLADIKAASIEWPKRRKGEMEKPLKGLFKDAGFLAPYVTDAASTHEGGAVETWEALAQDWQWIRPHMLTLLGLVQEFERDYARAKREFAVVDFSDLEQFALRLLWKDDRPSDIAKGWRQRLELVFVDEYQDINGAQDRIIRAVSREGDAANRFLVGDVKQSIYRFRLANPHIFLARESEWAKAEADGRTLLLADNFRSRENLLEFVNELFAGLMRAEVGGVEFGDNARIRFGARELRRLLSIEADPSPRVELQVQFTGDAEADGGDDDGSGLNLAELSTVEKEARLIALRLIELKEDALPVWDNDLQGFRAVRWSDMAVLLRSPRNRAESFAKEFARAGVPLEASRNGFFDTTEVSDLLSLLMLLDNPLQDVPTLAVLRSPLVGLSLNELTVIRLFLRKGHFWKALTEFHQHWPALREDARYPEGTDFVERLDPNHPDLRAAAESAWPKVGQFLPMYWRWRRLARQGSLLQCLETILDETCYEDWLLAQPRGEQCRANVHRLLGMARKFDQFQRQGLYRFLRFIEAQRVNQIEREPAGEQSSDAVRLMSVHQSKGLEFPVVVVGGLGNRFNLSDLRGNLILDEVHGLCPRITPPGIDQNFPSVTHWLAARRQREELLGEELRLLYVAMTRARDLLILSGTCSRKAADERWIEAPAGRLSTQQLLKASSAFDWLGPRLTALLGDRDWFQQDEGASSLLTWRIVDDSDLSGEAASEAGSPAAVAPDAGAVAEVRSRLAWSYPQLRATREPAKTTVTTLRQETVIDEDAWHLAVTPGEEPPFRLEVPIAESSTAIGSANHRFLQLLRLAESIDLPYLAAEANRLKAAGLLTPREHAALNLQAVADFWASDLGRTVLKHREGIGRELPFTARFTVDELDQLRCGRPLAGMEATRINEEFVVIQGIVDLVVVRESDLLLIDFKTDAVTPETISDKAREYALQIEVYAAALERVYGKPVGERSLFFLAARQAVRVGG